MKNVAIVLLISLAVLLVPTTVAAQNWILLDSTPVRNLYYDADSISDGPNGSKEVMTKFLFEQVQFHSGYNKYLREVSVLERYYSNQTRCALSEAFFYTDGTVRHQIPMCREKGRNVGRLWNILFE